MRTLLRALLRTVALGLAVVMAARSADVTIADLVKLVRTGIQQQTSDRILAKSIHKLTLKQKLDLRTIEELQSEGAGPESVAALDRLRDASAKQPVSDALPPFQSPARPTPEEQRSFFHDVNVNAMRYSRSLPDFICNEVIHRYTLTPPRPPGSSGSRRGASSPVIGEGFWVAKDILTVKLSYFENHEKYELTLVNGRKTRDTYESSGGAISEGDFGSTLLEIFSPESGTKFQWDHWTHLRKRLTRVYAYYTSRERSHYRIGVGARPDERRTIVAGRHGFIYADDATRMVMRITGEAEAIPLGFPVTAQSSMLDYDYAAVGDRQFLLPLRADLRMTTPQIQFKNVVEFHDYRKFTGESTISFDAPDSASDGAAAPEKK